MLGSKTILMLVKKIISISKGTKFEGYYRFKINSLSYLFTDGVPGYF